MGDAKRWDNWLDGEDRNQESSDQPIPYKTWMRKNWWDEEPDEFSVQVKNAAGNPERFLVVSGNSTWLSLQQAKEVRSYLDECIHNMETLGEAKDEDLDDPPRPRRTGRTRG